MLSYKKKVHVFATFDSVSFGFRLKLSEDFSMTNIHPDVDHLRIHIDWFVVERVSDFGV